MCWGRVLCLLDHLTETDRFSKGQVLGPRPIPPTATVPPSKALDVCTFQRPPREPAHQQASRFAGAHFSETHILMLPPKAFELEPRLRRVSSCGTTRLQREEYRLRLKRLPPVRRGGRFPPLDPRPAVKAVRSCASAFLRRAGNENSCFRLGKKNCASLSFSLPNGIQGFREEKGERRQMAQAETATVIKEIKCSIWNTQLIGKHAYYYEHQSHHHQ